MTRRLAGSLLFAIVAAGCPAHRPPDAWRADVLLIAPLDVELAAARAVLATAEPREIAGREAFTGTTATGTRVAVIRSGWGKGHAAGAVAAGVAAFAPSRVVVAGIGGGLDGSGIESGDVVIGNGSYQHDLGKQGPAGFERWAPEDPRERPLPKLFVADAELVRELGAAAVAAPHEAWRVSDCACKKNVKPCDDTPRLIGRERFEVVAGVIATGDVFVADPALAAKLRADAIAIDMETAAAAQEALNHGLPFATVRVIADVAGRPESESVYYCVKPLAAKRLESVLRGWLR